MSTPMSPPSSATKSDANQLHVEAHEQQRRQRERDARGDRLAGRARRLHDVVLEDRRGFQPERAGQPLKSVIESTATGIDAETVSPTLSPR